MVNGGADELREEQVGATFIGDAHGFVEAARGSSTISRFAGGRSTGFRAAGSSWCRRERLPDRAESDTARASR